MKRRHWTKRPATPETLQRYTLSLALARRVMRIYTAKERRMFRDGLRAGIALVTQFLMEGGGRLPNRDLDSKECEELAWQIHNAYMGGYSASLLVEPKREHVVPVPQSVLCNGDRRV